MKRIWLSPPHIGCSEMEYVNSAFEKNWIAPIGPHIDLLESKLSKFVGRPTVVMSSGTAALHLALIIAGVQTGDNVLCQSLTFCGSANPILYLGANPIFIDSEKQTWNVDPELLESAILDCIKKGKKPKAIVYVHLYGMPAQIDEIKRIATEYSIFLIEDAAEALGSEYHGQKTGNFGDISILSFNGNKIITTSGGGALVAEEKFTKKARFLATQAREAEPHYEHIELGYNYRMSNVSAAIGCGQMEVLEQRVASRRKNFEFYKNVLSDIPGISFLSEPKGYFSNRWLTTILVDPTKTGGLTREDIRKWLDAVNIESRPVWKPMHLQPLYKTAISYQNGVSDYLFSNGLCLPSGSNLSEEDLKDITNAFVKFVH